MSHQRLLVAHLSHIETGGRRRDAAPRRAWGDRGGQFSVTNAHHEDQCDPDNPAGERQNRR